MKKLLLAACAVVVVVMGVRWVKGDSPLSLVTVKVENPYPRTSPLYAASQRFVDGVNADPKLRDRFSGVFTKRGLYAEVTTALRRGARSLDGPVLVGATTAMDRAMPHLDTHTCAEAFRVHDTFDAERSAKMRDALEQISPMQHAHLMDFYLQALKAEVDDAPVQALDQDALQSALRNLGDQYQGEYAQRFANAMRDKAAASDEDLCWAGTTLLHGVTLMGDRDREVLSRWGLAGG
jgi:hypothetical protein